MKIEKLIGKTFVLQLKLNDYNWKGGREFKYRNSYCVKTIE